MDHHTLQVLKMEEFNSGRFMTGVSPTPPGPSGPVRTAVELVGPVGAVELPVAELWAGHAARPVGALELPGHTL